MILGIAVAAVFAATVLFLMRFMPTPRSSKDYLIIGGLATLVSMMVLFGALFSILRSPGPFFKRRRK